MGGLANNLFCSSPLLQLHLCCGSESLGKGRLSLNPLKSVNRIDCTVPLGSDASIDVIVQLDRAPGSAQKPRPPPQLLTEDGRGQSAREKAEQAQLHPHPSAKRNLTQSFEDASLATPTHSSLSGEYRKNIMWGQFFLVANLNKSTLSLGGLRLREKNFTQYPFFVRNLN